MTCSFVTCDFVTCSFVTCSFVTCSFVTCLRMMIATTDHPTAVKENQRLFLT